MGVAESGALLNYIVKKEYLEYRPTNDEKRRPYERILFNSV